MNDWQIFLKTNDSGEVGHSVKRKLMKHVETGDLSIEELVKKIHMNDPKVGEVGKSVRFWSRRVHET